MGDVGSSVSFDPVPSPLMVVDVSLWLGPLALKENLDEKRGGVDERSASVISLASALDVPVRPFSALVPDPRRTSASAAPMLVVLPPGPHVARMRSAKAGNGYAWGRSVSTRTKGG